MKLTQVIPGVISLVPIIVLCINIPMLIVEFRKSSILKRLASSNVKKHNIILAFTLYGVLISVLSSIFVLVFALMIFPNRTALNGIENGQVALSEALKNVHWTGFLLSYFLMLILASGIGILVASVSRNSMSAMAIGLFILVPGGFLSGQYLNPSIIISDYWMNFASYFVWQKYPTNLMIAAFDGHNIFSQADFSN